MKKIISLMLVLVLSLCMFAGCKPKIEDTEEYRMVCVAAERMEQEQLEMFSRDTSFASTYDVTCAQYIKKVEVDYDFKVVMQTEDDKYHIVDLADVISVDAKYDMYFVITSTYAKKNKVTDLTYIYLTRETTEKLVELIDEKAAN